MRISEILFPRIVCLVTTVNLKRNPNVMTASFVMPISFEPKYVAFSIAPSRYSFENLNQTKEFGLNVCSEAMEEVAKICGSWSGKEKDKFKLARLTQESSRIIKPPVIKESPVSFECRVEALQQFGDHFLVVGKVVEEHLREKEFKPLLHYTGNKYLRVP